MKRRILIIYTGGTIGMKNDEATGALVPFDFGGIYEEFPSLHRLEVDLRVETLGPIDSSNVQPSLWQQLSRRIGDRYDAYDGFVVLHGTDTMSYSASALSFMLENLGKPVIFTGSQIPIGVLRTDGRENLITAIEIAAACTDAGPVVPEVALYFHGRLLRANRSTKRSAEELDAFCSPNYPPLAEVGVSIHFNTGFILPPPPPGARLRVRTELECGVALVKLFPGLGRPVLQAMIGSEQVRGIVMETYGAGNAPTEGWFLEQIGKAIARGAVVMNVTQCPGGSVKMDLYDTGLHLQELGVVCGADSTTEAALAKMMVVLGRKGSFDEAVTLLKKPLHGEITSSCIARN